MLHIRTVVKESPIHGLGLFAAEPIAKGTLISAWDPVFDVSFSNETIAALPLPAREFIQLYGWPHDGRMRLELDGGRYVNHSETPNVRVKDDEGTSSIAARDIAVGEELTEDYAEFNTEFAKLGFAANRL